MSEHDEKLEESGVPLKIEEQLEGIEASLEDSLQKVRDLLGRGSFYEDLTPEEKAAGTGTGNSKISEVVFLEVGHGDHPDGFGPGAVDERSGIREWDMNKVCAEACKKQLERIGFCNVFVLDPNDYLFNIGKKGSQETIFVSVHHNSFYDDAAQGAEALVHDKVARPQDRAFAGVLAEHMSGALGITNRGVKTMSLSVLEGATNSAINNAVCLVEPYFISGKEVSVNKLHKKWSIKSGIAIAHGIHAYLKSYRGVGNP